MIQLPPIRIVAGLALAACAATASAQPASQRPPASETVELSPFQVSAEAVRGYAAAETMTGSRVKTQIVDLPYTVNVLTSEFFEDFAFFSLSDNITQIGGFTGLDIGGNFNLRGFSSSNQLRDGFFRLGRYGSSNIDRMEIIKGSSAAIYGRTSPGGMINMISKSPRSAAEQKLTYNFGDYGTQRLTFEGTGPLLPNALGETRFILTGSHYQRDFDQAYARDRNHEYYLAVDHKFADASKLFLSFEYYLQVRHAPPSALPLVTDLKGTTATTDDVALGYALNLGTFNAQGDHSELNRGNTGLTGTYEKSLSRVFSTRLSGNYYKARRWDYNYTNQWTAITVNAAPSLTTPVRTARGATPSRGRIYEDGGGFQGDLLAHYWTNGNRVEHRTLLTLDINDYYRWDPTLSYAAATNADLVAWSTARFVNLDANLNPTGPIAYFPKWSYESTGEVATRRTKRHTTATGGNFRQQTSLLGGSLLTYAGVRYDNIRYQHRDLLTAATSFRPFIPDYVVGQVVRKELDQLKPNVGANYKLASNLRVFGNYSESYFVNQGDTPLQIADPGYRSETAKGYDYGFKGSLLGERVSYTVSGYYIGRSNVSVTDLVETTPGSGVYLDTTRSDGSQLVRGYEADVNWSLTPSLALLASYSRINSIYTNYGSSFPAAVGRPVQFISPYNGSINLKYTASRGGLKGFSANAGWTFVGATPTEAPNAGDVYAVRGGVKVVTSSTGQWALKAPAYDLVNLGVRYALPAQGGYTHTFAINLNNAFDQLYLRAGSSTATRLRGEHRAVYFTYSLTHKGARF